MGDVAARFNVEVAHKFSLFTGLNRDEDISKDVGGVGFNLFSGKSDFNAPFHDKVARFRGVEVPLSPAASMDLRFDSDHL